MECAEQEHTMVENTSTTELTSEQAKAVRRFRKQREYHREYYKTHKAQVLAYHAKRRAKDAEIVRSLKAKGITI